MKIKEENCAYVLSMSPLLVVRVVKVVCVVQDGRLCRAGRSFVSLRSVVRVVQVGRSCCAGRSFVSLRLFVSCRTVVRVVKVGRSCRSGRSFVSFRSVIRVVQVGRSCRAVLHFMYATPATIKDKLFGLEEMSSVDKCLISWVGKIMFFSTIRRLNFCLERSKLQIPINTPYK